MHVRRSALVIVLCLSAVGCGVDGGGYGLMALNEWDQDVIVAVTGNTPESKRVPARTYGVLSQSWADPAGDLTVFDTSCRPLASFSMRSDQTVRIGPAGEIEVSEPGFAVPEGIPRDTYFPAERCP